jgi:prepilin-type N-terminal cleavage/methylation domain-containing protein
MNAARQNIFLARGGFTLIELLLAMTLIVIVAATLFVSMSIAFKATSAADRALEPSRTADLAMELISSDLQNAVPPNTTITNANDIYDFDQIGGSSTAGSAASASSSSSTGSSSMSGGGGSNSNAAPAGWLLAGPFEGTQGQGTGAAESDDLVFFTINDSPVHPDANGEIKMVEIKLDQPKGSNELCLVRKVTANLTSESPLAMDEEILCRGVTGLTLQYFDGTDWNTSWDSTQQDNTIPAAVQMTINLQRGQANGQPRTLSFTRVFTLSCSTAAQDSNVNPNVGSN